LGIFTHCVELTTEQVDFYLEHPTASINEIKNCELITEVNITLHLVQQECIENLSKYSLDIARSVIPDYKIQNAITSLLYPTTGIYTVEESQQILLLYSSVGTTCRNKFYDYKKLILACKDIDEVYEITAEARGEYLVMVDELENLNAQSN
jgi:hypothetical protein